MCSSDLFPSHDSGAAKNDEEVLRGELGSGAAVVALQCARGIGRMRGAKRRAEGIARPEGTRPKKGQKKGLRCDGTLDLMRLSGF